MILYFRGKSGSYLLEAAVILPVIIVISMMLLMLMLFLYGNTQDAVHMGMDVRRAAAKESQTVIYDTPKDRREFSLMGSYRNQVDKSGISKRRDGMIVFYRADTRRSGRFLSLFSFEARSVSKAVWPSVREAHVIRTADLVFENIAGAAGETG